MFRRLISASFVVVGSCLPPGALAQEAGDPFYVAMSNNVDVVPRSSLVVVIGRPSSMGTAVLCAPGTPEAHAAVIVDAGEGRPQQADILIFRQAGDGPIPMGTRIRIDGGPSPCNADLRLYTGTVE